MGTKEYDELKRRRDDAAKKAAQARERADELEEAAKSLEQIYNQKMADWQSLVDFVQNDFDKALIETTKMEHELEILRDDVQVLDLAQKEKGGELNEEEQKQAKEKATMEALELEKKLEKIQSGFTSRHEYNQSEKKKVDDAKQKWDDAKQQSDQAAIDADKLEDDAIGAEETTTKVRCWLGWDGMFADEGDCNKSYGETKSSKAASARRNQPLTKEDLKKRIDSSLVDEVYNKISDDKVSVRIDSCTNPFVPILERNLVGIDLKRSNLIKSLLFRVRDKDGTTVYQERLDEDQIDKLPRSSSRAARHAKSFQDRYDSVTGVATPAQGPYTFSVWISANKNAFDKLAPTANPKETSDVQVHDRTRRSDDMLLKAGDGVNQATPKKVRLVCSTQMVVRTDHDASERNQRTVSNKVLEIADAIDEANNAFKRKPLDDEILLFLAPEWNFQTDDASNEHLYTENQRDAIIDQVLELSKAAPKWLICPGTILWGMKNKALGLTATFNTAIFAAKGKEVFRYHKKSWGSDISTSMSAFESKAAFNEGRHTTLNKGKLPDSIQKAFLWRSVGGPKSLPAASVTTLQKDKRWKVTINKADFIIFEPVHKLKTVVPAIFWANDLDDAMWRRCMPSGVQHSDYLKTHFFTHRELKFGVEICADHKGGRGAIDYVDATNPGRGMGNDAGVDIHVVTSCDVDLVQWKTVARKGGCVVHCDGSRMLGNVLRVSHRNQSVTKVGQVIAAARQAAADEEKKALEQGRDAKPVPAKDPGSRIAPTVCGEIEEPQIINKTDYTLHLVRMVLVDP